MEIKPGDTIEGLTQIIENYKLQNPKKFELKKEYLLNKLEFMRAGGNPIDFKLAEYLATKSVAEKDAETKKERKTK